MQMLQSSSPSAGGLRVVDSAGPSTYVIQGWRSQLTPLLARNVSFRRR